jgi:hypothetical protein
VVTVRRLGEQPTPIPPAAEAGAVPLGVLGDGDGQAPLLAAGVERRVEVGELEGAVGKSRQHVEAVAQQDGVVHAERCYPRRRLE